MLTYTTIKDSSLDYVLKYGLGGEPHHVRQGYLNKPVWMTIDQMASAASDGERELFQLLHPGEKPETSGSGLPVFAFTGAVRLTLRIRNGEQASQWRASDFSDDMDQRWLWAQKMQSKDSAKNSWLVSRVRILPTQIIGVAEWSSDDQDWIKVPTGRRVVPHRMSRTVKPTEYRLRVV